jgi:hypothetical protein
MTPLTLVLALGNAHAVDLRVNVSTCDDSLADLIYCTIQEAVDDSSDGDVILLVAGWYNEPFDIGGRTLTVESASGREATAIGVPEAYSEADLFDFATPDTSDTAAGFNELLDAEGVEHMVTVSGGGELTLRGVTLTGEPNHQAFFDALVSDSLGIPLLVDVHNPLLCVDYQHPESAIHVLGATVTLDDVDVRCFSANSGGAIYAPDGSEVNIIGSTLSQNTAALYGGHVYVSGDLFVDDSTLEFGVALISGGAVTAVNGDVTIQDSDLDTNVSSDRGGAIQVEGAGSVVLARNMFHLNTAFQAGASIETLPLDLPSITPNLGDGGAAYIEASDVDLYANVFCGGFSLNGGGAMLTDVPAAVVENNQFVGNWSVGLGGGLLLNEVDAVLPTGIDVYNNTFVGNTAGWIPNPPTPFVHGAGGGIFFAGATAFLNNNIIAFSGAGSATGALRGVAFEIGDPIDIEYNMMSFNCEDLDCGAGPYSTFASDLTAYTPTISNIVDIDPQFMFWGGSEGDCRTDALWTQYDSPVVDGGDPARVDVDGTRSDIGAFGGPRATVTDRDGDGTLDIYDCDDTNPDVSPHATEVCDFIDNDCDGIVDDGFSSLWYVDADGDGFGDKGDVAPTRVCPPGPPGTVDNNLDCDDTDPAIRPDAAEVCDGIDNQCNGIIDDPTLLVFTEYHPDFDGDGFGASGAVVTDCKPPTKDYVLDASDCDDEDSTVNPGAPEVCDDVDNDCDGTIDYQPVYAPTWSFDADGDGHGFPDAAIVACDAPGPDPFTGLAYVELPADDCLDTDPLVHPGADELCNGVDEDCDGIVDNDAADAPPWYIDADGDGFGDPATATFACEQPGAEYATNKGGDCDDADELIQECTGCSCDAASAPVGAPWLAAFAMLALGIRRRA